MLAMQNKRHKWKARHTVHRLGGLGVSDDWVVEDKMDVQWTQ